MRFSKLLLIISLAYFLLRLPWIFMVPISEAPDEITHLWVIDFICQHMRLPNLDEVYAGGRQAVYGTIPQLGYLPHVILIKLLPIAKPSLIGRFASLLCGYAAVVLSFFLGREIFPQKRVAALALPLALVFHPQFLLVNVYSNNDITGCALNTGILLLLIKVLKRGLKQRYAVMLGLMLGWVALSKYSAYAIFPTTAVALLCAIFIHAPDAVLALRFLVTVFGLFALTCGWWFVNRAHQYPGDMLGTRTLRDIWARAYNRPLEYYKSPWQIMSDRAWWRLTAFSFWGMFGYMTRYLMRPVYIGYLGFMAASAALGARDLFRMPSKLLAPGGSAVDDAAKAPAGSKSMQAPSGNTVEESVQGRRERLIDRSIWLSLATCSLFNIAAMIWASTINLGGAQGRYLFASEAPLMALLIAGLSKAGDRRGEYLVIAFIIFNALVAIGSFIWLAPIYGFRLEP